MESLLKMVEHDTSTELSKETQSTWKPWIELQPHHRVLSNINLLREMRTFMVKKHPLAARLEKFNFRLLKLKWQSNKNDNDCEVYLVKHMELFNGNSFNCDLKLVTTMKLYRAKLCSKIFFNHMNTIGDELKKKVVDFKEKRAHILLEMQAKKKEDEKAKRKKRRT